MTVTEMTVTKMTVTKMTVTKMTDIKMTAIKMPRVNSQNILIYQIIKYITYVFELFFITIRVQFEIQSEIKSFTKNCHFGDTKGKFSPPTMIHNVNYDLKRAKEN